MTAVDEFASWTSTVRALEVLDVKVGVARVDRGDRVVAECERRRAEGGHAARDSSGPQQRLRCWFIELDGAGRRPRAVGATVAVNVTLCPKTGEVGEEATVVVVFAAGATVTVTGGESLDENVPSVMYFAVTLLSPGRAPWY